VNLEFRGIERQEVAAAVALIIESTLSVGSEDPGRLEDYWDAVLDVRERGGEVIVVVDDGDVVGMCQLIIFRHFQHTAGWCAELESVYVRSDRRGQGVGSAILAFAEDWARRSGCYRMQLTSRNERLDAHRFYRAQGYLQMSQGFKKSLID
jgi:GNAT superfamily N-acetyltransferase